MQGSANATNLQCKTEQVKVVCWPIKPLFDGGQGFVYFLEKTKLTLITYQLGGSN